MLEGGTPLGFSFSTFIWYNYMMTDK